MRHKTLISIAITALALAAGLAADDEKTGEPFYRKYLVAGNRLDDRILEQERRVQEEPGSADRHNDLGNLLAARRFVEDARREYEKALELDSEHYLAAYNLGLLWETEGKSWKAMSAYRKAIKRKPGFPHSHFRLGRLYEQRGWGTRAVSEYAKALRLDPKMRDPKRNPLVVDSRLIHRASLENYPRDVAVASLAPDQAYADESRFRDVPTDLPVSSDEVGDLPEPEPIDSTVSPRDSSSAAPTSLPLEPGQTRPQLVLPPGAPPLAPLPTPTPVP